MEPVRTAQTDQLLLELTQSKGREYPYPRYQALREQAPVALAEDGAIVLTRYADCQAVLQNHSFGRPDSDEVFTSLGLAGWRDMAALYTLNTSMLTL
ncbi:MAG: cytochrome P450, partial [Jatrophihabitans sp.]